MTNDSKPGSFGQLLRQGGFQSFLWTQFLGAFNDNVYKMAVQMRAVHVMASAEASSKYLALAGAVFVLPFLLFSGYSGQLADRTSKRKVLVWVKVFEIFVMGLGVAAFYSSSIELMLGVLFLMAVHSTLFSPAKYGIVPEMLPDRDLSRANALLEMSTFVAIVLGTALGGALFAIWKTTPWYLGYVMTGIAVIGFLTSLGITRVPASGTREPFHWNPVSEAITGTRSLLRDRPLWLAVVAISYFWFLGALFQMDLLQLGSEVLKVDDFKVSLMVTFLAVGIGTGSMLAGKLSGDKVELGLVPLGSILMSICSVALWAASHSYVLTVIALAFLGVASGLFIVPLNAFLQQRAESTEKGRILAVNNIWNTLGVLLASGTLYLLHDKLHVSPDRLILVFGFVTLGATFFIVRVVPEYLLRLVLALLTHTVFKVRIVGQDNIPARGPALLVANHVSYIDGLLLGCSLQRIVRFLVYKPIFDNKAFGWLFRIAQAIPVGEGGPRATVESLRRARKELEQGELVGIFAEGGLSRTGNLLPFKPGFERIVAGLDAPIIPVYLDGLWGSIFSYEGGKFFWKWPKRIPYPVTITFGAPMSSASTVEQVRNAVQELGSRAVEWRKSHRETLPGRFVSSAKSNWRAFAMADSTGRELTYGETLTAALLLANRIQRDHAGERMLGLMLPSSVGGALVNLGVSLAGKVPVNLNFTSGNEAMESAMDRCEIRTVITSRAFLSKAKLATPRGAVYVEDLLAAATPWQKALAFLKARWFPARLLAPKVSPDDLATVIFSSGSTGIPKGVMLSHYNLIANIDGMVQVFSLTERDRITGGLPFFHSFGFTATLWLPLVSGCGALYHANPTDARILGDMIAKHRGTFLLTTPTFSANYVRKCTREQLASLRFVLVGAERLREATARTFRDALGHDLLQGYGCTEMSPVVAVNVPDVQAGRETQTGTKPGSVGHPLPGVAVKVVDPVTLQPLAQGQEGLLLVRGANRMLGYLGQPERTAEVMHDDWYVTGDIATVDRDGFVCITDRLSRFSKIAGEMVPHLRVEEALYQAVGDFPCAVTGIPDGERGERLVALYTRPDIAPAEVWQQLSESPLPRLWIPKRGDVHRVETLPALSTGKTDLRGVRALAIELSGEDCAAACA